jgi:hypothetical protein
MNDLVERAARAMLEYEAWLQSRVATSGGSAAAGAIYQGVTADAVITAETGADIHAWAWYAGAAISRAAELRGCSATASRVRGQRLRSQATGRRTIPRHNRRAA